MNVIERWDWNDATHFRLDGCLEVVVRPWDFPLRMGMAEAQRIIVERVTALCWLAMPGHEGPSGDADRV